MFDAEFHEHHYKLVDFIDGSVELDAQQKILDDYECRNINLFTRITNVRCCEKTITPLPKPVEEMIYIGVHNSRLQLITSRTRIIDKSIDQTKVETVESGVLEHLLEQVDELQTDLEVIIL